MSRPRYQGSDAWLAERKGGIGSSDVPTLVGGDEQAWRDLFAVKLGILPDQVANETMTWGHRLEDVIAQAYTERTGHKVQRVDRILRHPDLPYVRASLDRWRPGAVVELKKWGFQTSDFGPDGSDQVPDAMAYQVQQQLAVTGRDQADVAVLFAGQRLAVYSLGRDQGTIDQLLALEERVWGYVQRGQVPPWPGPAAVRPLLTGGEIEADERLSALVAQRQRAQLLEREAVGLLVTADEAIKAELADVPGARGPGFHVSYRPNKDSVRVGWEQVAAAYRKRAVELGADPEQLAAIESLFTTTKPGARPLLVHVEKGATLAIAT